MAFVDAAPPSRWSFVYPWCRALRGRVRLEGQVVDDSSRWEYCWVVVRLPHTPEEGLLRIREALDLLARIAVLDNDAWKALLVQQCRILRNAESHPIDYELSPKFRFVFNEKFLENDSLSPAVVCRRFFVDTTTQRVSEEYLEARRVLQQLETPLDSRNQCSFKGPESLLFELQFELVTLQDDILERHLRDLSAMFDVLQATGGSAASWGPLLPLQLESVRLDVGRFNASWSLTQRLTRLLCSGPPFSLFAFILKKSDTDKNEQERMNLGHFFRAVLCNEVIDTGEANQGGIQSLSVGCNDCDQWQFMALCSAVATATTTKNLQLYGVFQFSDSVELRSWKWRWMTYALFRTDAESSVTKALISNAHLSHDCNSVIAAALSTSNPPDPSFGENSQEGSQMQNINWSDKSGYFHAGTELSLHSEETYNHEIMTSILLEEDSWLDIVSSEDNPASSHLDVVLPGFGVVRADRTHVRKLEQCRPLRRNDRSFGSKVLTLGNVWIHGDDDGVLDSFLKLVGGPLKVLAIYSNGSYPISMAAVCQACPHLRELFLDGVQLARSDNVCADGERRNSQIMRLGLVNAFSTNEDITRLAETLARPMFHFTEQLSELYVNGSDMGCEIDKTNVLAFLKMLNTNRKLTYLSLGMDPELKEQYEDAFQRHHGEPLAVVKHKLAVECKAAFLSIPHSSTSAGSALDEGVLSLIFSFAATCANRVVNICDDT